MTTTVLTVTVGVISVLVNVLTIFIVVGKLHVKNREDITALQVNQKNIKEDILRLENAEKDI